MSKILTKLGYSKTALTTRMAETLWLHHDWHEHCMVAVNQWSDDHIGFKKLIEGLKPIGSVAIVNGEKE